MAKKAFKNKIKMVFTTIALIGTIFLCAGKSVVGTPVSDQFEPNDSFGEAVTLTFSVYRGLSIHAAGNNDYYKIHLNAGENISIVLWNLTADIELSFWYANQTCIYESTYGGTSVECINYVDAYETGDYFIRVYGSVGEYTITITHIFDVQEPNNTAGSAVVNTYPKAIRASLYEINSHDRDDYYKFTIPIGANVTFVMERFAGGYNSYELEILRPNLALIDYDSAYHNNTNPLHPSIHPWVKIPIYNAPVAGDYVAHVSFDNIFTSQGEYALYVFGTTAQAPLITGPTTFTISTSGTTIDFGITHNGALFNYTVIVDGTGFKTGFLHGYSSPLGVDVASLSPGVHDLELYVTDYFDNVASHHVSVTVGSGQTIPLSMDGFIIAIVIAFVAVSALAVFKAVKEIPLFPRSLVDRRH